MEIKLDYSQWLVDNGDEFFIEGNKDDGYKVTQRIYDDEIEEVNEEILFESKDFEECLVWCYNS